MGSTHCILPMHSLISAVVAVLLQPSMPPNVVAPADAGPADALFTADDTSSWACAESLQFDGYLVKRPFEGKWDDLQSDIDDACSRFEAGRALGVTVAIESPRQFSLAIDRLLAIAALPAPLGHQIHEDACALCHAWTEMCPEIQQLSVKLELFGENTCARWHRDNFIGRASSATLAP